MEADGLSVEERAKGHHRECHFSVISNIIKNSCVSRCLKKNEKKLMVCGYIMTVEYPLTN